MSDIRVRLDSKNIRFALPIIILLCLFWAWLNRFTPDDAFITFRYAKNLSEGQGAVWNPGEFPVEGYSTFLWMLLMSIPHFLGINVLAFAQTLGLVCMGGTMWFSFRIFRKHFSEKNALILLFLLGSNFTFASFSVSGMETQFFTLLFVFNLWLLSFYSFPETQFKRIHGYLLGFSLALLPLARPEGILLAGILGIAYLLQIRKRGNNYSLLVWLAMGFAWVLGLFLYWKFTFYGELLPNTFYAKTGNPSIIKGFLYVLLFLASYFIPGILAILPGKWSSFKTSPLVKLAAVYLAIWTVYLIAIGGDFMEFRMWIPMMPLIWLLIGSVLFRVNLKQNLRWLALSLFFVSNIFHAFTFGEAWYSGFVISQNRLQHEVAEPNLGLAAMGKKLHALLGDKSTVRLAVSQAGALPYYSKLPCTDVLGLNDAWVARHGNIASDAPGHHRIAPLNHLLKEGVNLIVSRRYIKSNQAIPEYLDRKDQKWRDFALVPDQETIPESIQNCILIPLDHGNYLVAIYLLPHPQIEKLINQGKVKLIPFSGHNLKD